MKSSIQSIVNECLCTACGGCMSICPQKAISLNENIAGFIQASVDENLCVSCGLCRKVCPSDSEYAIVPNDPLHGVCLKSYIAYSNNDDIRQKGQSGGLVTSLLCYLIDNNIIDGAVVNRYTKDNNRSEAVFVDSCDKIIECAGSKYTQSSVIPAILSNKDSRLAAVTLGCQSESLNQIRTLSPRALDNLVYVIGLICAGQNSTHMTRSLLAKMGMSDEERKVANFSFRSKDPETGGWPGKICATTPSKKYILSKEKRLELKPVYESYRCILCYDQMNVFSDIVCGDPWGIKIKDAKKGYTVVISRTRKGQELLVSAEKAGYISLTELPLDSVFKGQTVDSRHLEKVALAKSICTNKGWSYPYPPLTLDIPSVSKSKYKSIEERMSYSRAYYKCASLQEENKLSRKRIRITRVKRKIIIVRDYILYYLKKFI